MKKSGMPINNQSGGHLPRRHGDRPQTSRTGPHAQLTDRSTPALWGELVARAFSIDGIRQGHSSVSMPDSMAGLLPNFPHEHGEWSLAVKGAVEPFHIHGVSDTSLHVVLPEELAKVVCAKGWGEPHTYADFPTQIMIYAPRNVEELDVVTAILKESVLFAHQHFAQ